MYGRSLVWLVRTCRSRLPLRSELYEQSSALHVQTGLRASFLIVSVVESAWASRTRLVIVVSAAVGLSGRSSSMDATKAHVEAFIPCTPGTVGLESFPCTADEELAAHLGRHFLPVRRPLCWAPTATAACS
jgi:hypothetical protein